MNWCLTVSLSLFLAACADKPTQISLRSVLDEAKENELASTSRLAGQKLLVRGKVEQTGVKKQGRWRHSGTSAAIGASSLAIWTAESEKVHDQIPYAILSDGDDGPGRAVCFFEMFDIDDIAKLKVGQPVQFEAKLQEFMHKDGQEIIVLHCRVIPNQPPLDD